MTDLQRKAYQTIYRGRPDPEDIEAGKQAKELKKKLIEQGIIEQIEQ